MAYPMVVATTARARFNFPRVADIAEEAGYDLRPHSTAHSARILNAARALSESKSG
jgi:hypothetical protein